MEKLRLAVAAATLVCLAAPAGAEVATPRSGERLGPGEYCARGVRAVVPEGFEAVSFGNGVEVSRPGGRSVLELSSFPRRGGMPSFESFLDRIQLPCKEGFAAETRKETRDAPGLASLDVLVRRCVGPSSAYGFYFSRATLTVDGGDHDASVMTMFGDEPFTVGRVAFTEDHFFPEDAAAALFETMTGGLAACAIKAPPPPPPPPPPTAWLGAGAQCAFTIGATAPEGFEFRFNGLARNGGVIDLRLAGTDGGYHRSRILVSPLRGADPAPPKASTSFDRCPSGFAPKRAREILNEGGEAETHVLIETCASESGAYFGSIQTTRRLRLPRGDHQVRGDFRIGSPDLPRNFAWTEFKSLTEGEVRAVINGFIGSMRACGG